MGTVLSISPKNNHYNEENGKEEIKNKKHGMFLNALSWKKLSTSVGSNQNQYHNNKENKKLDQNTSGRNGNIHPLIDTNKNIANALCHGAKSTSLSEKKLDLAPLKTKDENHYNNNANIENNIRYCFIIWTENLLRTGQIIKVKLAQNLVRKLS